jgi:predicted permease
MSPLFYVVLALAALLALSIVGHIAQAEARERQFRQFGGELPTISSLPRNINKPTALRREVGRI